MEATQGHVSFTLKVRWYAMSPAHPILAVKKSRHFLKSVGEGYAFISMCGSQDDLRRGNSRPRKQQRNIGVPVFLTSLL